MDYSLGILIELLEQILHHKHWVLDPDHNIPQIAPLLEMAFFLKDTLAKCDPGVQARIESLQDRIRDAAEMAEDVLESHIADQIRSTPDGSEAFTICCPDLHRVLEEFESAKKEIVEIMSTDANRILDQEDDGARQNVLHNKSAAHVVVGVTQDLNQLRERLLGESSKLEIIPIVGVGGTGKTTVTRILYDEFSFAILHFDVCAWATLSRKCNLREILLSLLRCIIGKPGNEILEENNEELIVTLNEILWHRRYLIVLDDIRGIEAWDALQKAFPDDNVRSRIILTCRENDVAECVGFKSHQMQLLNKDDSWELLRKNVYGEESFPPELEEVGEVIAAHCRGLPLAIQLLSGLLSEPGVKQNKDFWEKVAYNVNSFIATQDEQFSRIFSLSYDNLPHYVKPCLLYMASFLGDDQIDARRIVMLWAAEGLLDPIGDRTREDVAEIYMKILTERNLICISRRSRSSGEAKAYVIPDLLRDQCVRKAEQKKFLYVEQVGSYNITKDTLGYRRARVHVLDETDSGLEKITPLTRSILYTGHHGARRVLASIHPELSLLRVLDLWEEKFSEFPEEILQLVNLRYLALFCQCELPESISKLRNLQTLIWFDIKDSSIALIFDLPQLRHFVYHYPDAANFILNYAPLLADRSFDVQQNLQSVSYIPLSILIPLLGKVPNMRELRVTCDATLQSEVDLTCFTRLEKFCCYNMPYKTMCFFTKFPDSLKQISLYGCQIPETVMNTIGMLANLQMIKFERCFSSSKVWEVPEGQFCSLQFLHVSDPDLVSWSASESSFPKLRHLVMEYCSDIEYDLPDIGGIETLEIIEVNYVFEYVKDWARKIVEEQRYLGKNRLQVRINGSVYEPGKVSFCACNN